MALVASPERSRSVAARSFAKTIQCGLQFSPKKREIAFDSTISPNHHMVGAGEAFHWHDLAGEGSKAALHSVTDHGATDFLGNGKTDAHGWVRIFAITDEQNEARGRSAPTAVRGKEVGALLKGC